MYTFQLPEWNFGVQRGQLHWGPLEETTFWTREEIVKVAQDCINANERPGQMTWQEELIATQYKLR